MCHLMKLVDLCNILKFERHSIFPSYLKQCFLYRAKLQKCPIARGKVFQNFVQEQGNAVFVVDNESNNEYERGNKV